jgi:LuxR family maltose regulon positive regulatory protein
MMSTTGLIEMAFEHGRLHQAFEIAVPAIARIEKAGAPPPPSAGLYGLLGQIFYQRYQLEESRRHILHARQLSMLGGYNSVTISHWALLSRVSQLEGKLDAAFNELQEALDLMQADTSDFARIEVLAQQVRVSLARNHLAVAEQVLQGRGFSFGDSFTFPDLSQAQNFSSAGGLLYNSSLAVLLYEARTGGDADRLRQGIALAERLAARALQGGFTIMALETLLLRAQMQAELGNSVESRADILAALELAQPQEIMGVFVEQGAFMASALTQLAQNGRLDSALSTFARRILAALSRTEKGDGKRGPVPLVEPLTERETDVLQLMAEGLTYKEIAGRLFISLNTVRFHVKSLYGKLNVRNRTQATEMGRQLQLF